MDLDVFVAAHRQEWARLEQLVRQARSPRSMSGADVDELVALYQRVATHLSVVQSAAADPSLVGRLSSLVARARGAVAGSRTPAWRDVARFLRRDLPAALYLTRRWWLGVTAAFVLVGFALGAWVESSPVVQARLAPEETVRQLVEQDFEAYYSSAPAEQFAGRVFTNNALIAAVMIALGPLLVPGPFLLWTNVENVAVAGGLMASRDRADLFFGLILPHGLLELTAVFIAAGVGMRLGWTMLVPGERTRSTALAEDGRSLVVVALGTTLLLAVSGVIEAYVTPSGLPTWGRITIGVVAELALLAWVFGPGRAAARAGVTGDLEVAGRGDALPSSG